MAGIEVRAIAKNVRGSPRKAGLVADVIRGKSVSEQRALRGIINVPRKHRTTPGVGPREVEARSQDVPTVLSQARGSWA